MTQEICVEAKANSAGLKSSKKKSPRCHSSGNRLGISDLCGNEVISGWRLLQARLCLQRLSTSGISLPTSGMSVGIWFSGS